MLRAAGSLYMYSVQSMESYRSRFIRMKGYYYSGGSMYHVPCAGVKSALETNPKLFEAKEKVK